MDNILRNIKLKLLILAVSVMILAMFPSTASAEGCELKINKTLDSASGGLGSHVNVTLIVNTTCGGVEVEDTLPKGFSYIERTFTVNGTPTFLKVKKGYINYVIDEPGNYTLEFEVKVTEAKSWEDMEVCNIAYATNDTITLEDQACYNIEAFEELHKNVGIPKADVVFAIDLTGSMTGQIATIKDNATAIMNNLAAQIADVQFGLITFMDYNGTYNTSASGYWYNATYGNSTPPCNDTPYRLDQDITNDTGTMATAIDDLVIGCGYDGPQDYTRIIHESYNDSNLNWRTGATRFLILFGDNVPHDTDFDINNNTFPDNTGVDPGRDNISGTLDDLNFETEVANAAANGVHILGVYSGWSGYKYPWTYMANQTDGGYFELDDVEDIPDAINEMMKAEAQETLTIEQMTETQWAVIIDVVNPFDYTMTDVVIKDRFGGEIEIDDCNLSTPEIDECNITHGTWSYYTKGKSKKVFLEWDIGDLLQGETARLILLVSTDLNPASKQGKQEYTSPGVYDLNSGATLKFIDHEDMQLSAYTDHIYVTVM